MEKIEVEEEREMEVSREKELFQLGTSGSLQTHCCFSTLIIKQAFWILLCCVLRI